MKPCADKQKLMTWLALDALNERQAQALRAHLETCAGCRNYLVEITHVTEQLASGKPNGDLQASETFHRNAVARMKAGTSASVWKTTVAALKAVTFNWRLAWPAAAMVFFIALRIWITHSSQPEAQLNPAEASQVPVVAAADAIADLSPTIANYQRAAGQSPDKLDELLAQQEKQTDRATPVYTAAAKSLSF